MKKNLLIICLIFSMFFGMCMPVFAGNTLELMNQKLNAFDGNLCTVKYYSPDSNYTNVLIIGTRKNTAYSVNEYHLVYIKPEQNFAYHGNAKCYVSDEIFYYLTFSTYEEAVECLFGTEQVMDYKVSPEYKVDTYKHCLKNAFTYPLVYLYQDTKYSDEAAASIEAAYYDWYIEKHGEEPKFEAVTPEGDSDDYKGIIGILQKIYDVLDFLNPFKMLEVDIIIGTVDTILDDALADNDFYISVCEIQNELTKLLAQDYSDPSGFAEVNPLKFTMRRVPIANAEGTSYTWSEVDWGIQDVSLIGDMKWFFGNHYSSGRNGIGYVNVDGSPAVKSFSDALISAILWISFAFTIWHRFPDLIAGEIATMGGIFGDYLHHEAIEERRNEEMMKEKEWTTTTINQTTGEITEFKSKQRRTK